MNIPVIKRALLLAAMALSAFAVSAPATAVADGAFQDVSTKKTIASGEILNLLGEVQFSSEGTGIRCEVKLFVKVKLADEFDIYGVEVNTKSCVGFGLLFLNCEVTGDNAPELPWRVQVENTDLKISPILMELNLAKCSSGINFIYGEIPFATGIVSKGTNGGITAVTLSGLGKVHGGFGSFEVEITGKLNVLGVHNDTWEIEELP